MRVTVVRLQVVLTGAAATLRAAILDDWGDPGIGSLAARVVPVRHRAGQAYRARGA